MKILIFTGGNHAEIDVVKKYADDYDCIIAADSGLDAVDRFGFVPNYIIGDMDSLENHQLLKKYSDAKIEMHPADKDFTDTELAIKLAHKLGATKIFLFGGGGSMRMDHLIYFLKVFEMDNPPALWVFDTGLGFCFGSGMLEQKLTLSLPVNSNVSVFNISFHTQCPNRPMIKSDGLHWNLDGVNWNLGQASISNRNDVESVELVSCSGRFLVLIDNQLSITVKHNKGKH